MTDDLHLMLGRVEGKLDALLAAYAGHVERLNTLCEDTNKLHTRVTILETSRSALKDWWALLISVASLLVVAYANLKGLIH